MDGYRRAWYEMKYELCFERKTGTEFQAFFANVMERRYPGGDYIRVRPWGRLGDQKNDGYLHSERMLFQVYAPDEITAAAACAKIQEDFDGAIPHWKQFFDHWIFVHNARRGLGPPIVKLLLDLDEVHKAISVKPWGFVELRARFFELSEEDIQALLGPAPSPRDFVKVGYEDLKAVLQYIARQPLPVPITLAPVPDDKIRINALSADTETLIIAGRLKSPSVGKFLAAYPDPEYGDQIVQAFKTKYDGLKAAQYDPDRIFRELQVFAGGELTADTKYQAAVLSVLAYLFDHCDIYETDRRGSSL